MPMAMETAAPLSLYRDQPAAWERGRSWKAGQPPVLCWERGGRCSEQWTEGRGSQWAKLHTHHDWVGNREGTPRRKGAAKKLLAAKGFGDHGHLAINFKLFTQLFH